MVIRNILLAAVAAVALAAQPIAASLPAAAADEVTVADDGLRACINKRLGQPADAPITQDQADGMTQLSCSTWNLDGAMDLAGIEAFQNLRSFSVSGSVVTSIDRLESLPQLTRLNLSETYLADISSLSGLTALTSLSLDVNQISDLTPLANLVLLEYLSLEGNQIEEISSLSEMTSLGYLSLQGNRVADISPLRRLASLYWLNLHENQVSDLSPLANMPDLYALWLGKNNISEVTLSESLVSLRDLSISENQVENVEPLKNFLTLDSLWLDGNHISDPSPLSGLKNTRRLDLSDNRISDLTSLQPLLEGSLLLLHGQDQTILLPDTVVGERQTFTLTNVYGEAVAPESETATVDPGDGSWVLPVPGEHALSWSSGTWREIELTASSAKAEGGPLSSDIFSGTITQTAQEVPISSDLTVKSPIDVTAREGATATFTASATSQVGINIPRWQQSTDNGTTWSEVPGPWTDTLRLENVSPSMTGNLYRVEYTNDTDGAVVLSDAAKLTVTAKADPPGGTPPSAPPALTPPGGPGKGLASTGEERAPQLWAASGAALVAGMLLLGVALRRRRSAGHDGQTL